MFELLKAQTSNRLHGLLLRVRPAPLAQFLKRALRVRRQTVETKSGRFWLDPATLIGREIIETGVFEPQMIANLERWLAPGSVFVDLGANEGYFTVLGAKLVGPSGRVIAIEPQERLAGVIEENLRLNGFQNVAVERAAVSNKSGKATLHLAPDTNTGSSGFINVARYSLPTQVVGLKTLAQVLDDHGLGRVDLLKVDIEGAEWEAILGSPEVFGSRRVKVLALELHPIQLAKSGRSGGDIEEFLTSAGYRHSRNSGTDVWIAPDL
jgi:FkbM family methyltransferase